MQLERRSSAMQCNAHGLLHLLKRNQAVIVYDKALDWTDEEVYSRAKYNWRANIRL